MMNLNQLEDDAMGVITNYFPTVYDAIRSAEGFLVSDLSQVEVIRIIVSLQEEEEKTILNFED